MFSSQRREAWTDPNSLVYERKFDTAIRESQIKNFLIRFESDALTFDDRLLVHSKWFNKDSYIHYAPDCFARILYQILKNANTQSKHIRHSDTVYHKAMSLAAQNLDIQSGYMTQSNYLTTITTYNEKLKSLLTKLPTNTRIAYLLRISNKLAEMVELTPGINSKVERSLSEQEKIDHLVNKSHYEIDEIGLKMSWSRRLCCISIQNKQYVLPQPYLLMIHNKVCDLISVLVLSEATCTSSNPENSTEIILEFIDIMIELIIEYKNDFFSISKDLEALGAAETLIECEEWLNEEFLNVLDKDIYKKIGFQYRGSELQKLLRKCDIPFRHEIMCLSKILGHPLVDMQKGSEALFKNTTESYEINHRRVNEATCYIKENYIRNHIAKKGKWPPSYVQYGSHPCLLQSQLRNKDPNHPEMVRQYGQITIMDYMDVELLPNAAFQKLENVIPHLKDRTVSLLRSKVMSSYLAGQKPESTWKDTRLLLFYLMRPASETDHVAFIEQYQQSENLEDLLDYLVIRIVPKEKEHKVVFRGFGCLEFHNRMRCVAQEKTSMKFLDDYSDEQAMSLSELGILLRLDSLRRLKSAYSKHHILYVTVDSTAWNNHFRRQTTDVAMAETMDKIHGTTVFGKTQLAYEKTLIYVPDENVTYSWDGQSGGIEGQNQDTWVITFLGHMKTALKDLNIKYHILCKGDDFRVALCVPISQVLKEELGGYKNQVVTALAGIAAEMGHSIKIDECYGSEYYLSFSKSASCGLVELPQSFRKIMKCHGANNAFLPLTDDMIASAYSNAHSACKVSSNTLGCYVVALFWAYTWVLQHRIFNCMTDDELVALMLIPSVVGGFPIIYLHNMYVRAEYDLLSPFLDILRYVTTHRPQVAMIMRNFCCVIPGRKEDYRRLFRDQASIPNSQPSLPSAVLRQSIIAPLRRITKNEDMSDLFEAAESDVNDAFMKCLNSADVMSVKVMANLYAATPEGLVQKFIRKFESSRSIYEVLIINKGYRAAIRILRKVMKAEIRLQKWRKNRAIEGPQDDEVSFTHLLVECPAESAQKVREWGWGKKIEGITMPPMVHQTYITTELQSGHDPWARNNHFHFRISDCSQNYSRDSRHHFAVGSYSPFFGHITKAGVTYPTVELEEKEEVLLAVQNLIDLASWVDNTHIVDGHRITSNVITFVDKLVKMYTGKSYLEMAPHASKKKSGTIHHHMRSPTYREAIMPNMLANRSTFVLGESNSHRLYRETGSHYLMNFLHSYCYCMHQLTIELEVDRYINTPEYAWGVTTKCEFCNKPITETPIVLNISYIRNVVMNPLSMTIVGRVATKVLKHDLLKTKRKTIFVPQDQGNLTLIDATMGIVSEVYHYHTTRVANVEIRYTQHHSTSDSVGLLERFLPTNMRKLISLTEMKKVDIRHLLSCIMRYVIFNLFKMFGTLPENDMKMSMRLVPAANLPWYGLIKMIYDVGRLGELMYELSVISDEPLSSSCQDHIGATYAIGQSAIDQREYIIHLQNIVILSDYEENIVWSAVEPQLEACKRMIMASLYEGYRGELSHMDAICLLISHWEPNAEDYTTAMIESGLENRTLTLMIDEDETPSEYFHSSVAKKKKNSTLLWLNSKLGKSRMDEGLEYLKNEYDSVLTEANNKLSVHQITVVVTTLSDCVSVIRSQDYIRPSYNLSDKLSVVGQEIIFEVPEDNDAVIQFRTPVDHISLIAYQPRKMRVFEQKELLLNRGHLNRKFGFSTRSASTLIEIFEMFHVRPGSFPKKLVMCALGEGQGAMTAIIGSLAPFGTCVYMTMPQNEGIETLPELAVWDTKMTIHYSHILTGIYDVSNHNHLEYLENTYRLNYDLVLSDLEPTPSDNDNIKYEIAICNAVSFYLRNRTPSGKLIIQYYIRSSDGLHDLLLYLGRYCTNIHVTHTDSIGCYRVVYVVCWGIKRTKQRSWIVKKDPPSESSSRCVSKIILMIERKQQLRLHQQHIDLLDAPKLKNKWYSYAPALFHHMMERFIGVGISKQRYMCAIPSSHDMIRLISAMNLTYETFGTESIVASLEEGVTHIRNQTWNNETRAHRIVLLHRLFAIEGFMHMIKQCIAGTHRVDIKLLKRHYLELLEELDVRDRVQGDTEHFLLGMDVNEQHIRYYYYFVQGVFTFLCMYTYLLHLSNKVFKVDDEYLQHDM